jgi:hypothetical protein
MSIEQPTMVDVKSKQPALGRKKIACYARRTKRLSAYFSKLLKSTSASSCLKFRVSKIAERQLKNPK